MTSSQPTFPSSGHPNGVQPKCSDDLFSGDGDDDLIGGRGIGGGRDGVSGTRLPLPLPLPLLAGLLCQCCHCYNINQ